MRTKNLALLVTAVMTLSACGGATEPGLPEDPDAPVIQITSEGGFAPVEMLLGRGPRYTLLSDGRLIYEGPTIAVYPGPLVPNYQVTTIDGDDMSRVLELVEAIGLPGIVREIDDSARSKVADATTEVATYWDEHGQHIYGVYALGIDLDEPRPANVAFEELLGLLSDLTAGEARGYEPSRVRIVAGPGYVDDEFEDVREWPLDNEGFSDWRTLPNGWMCRTFAPDVLGAFTNATQATVWRWVPGDPTLGDAEFFKLLVRPLHPGEPDCP